MEYSLASPQCHHSDVTLTVTLSLSRVSEMFTKWKGNGGGNRWEDTRRQQLHCLVRTSKSMRRRYHTAGNREGLDVGGINRLRSYSYSCDRICV